MTQPPPNPYGQQPNYGPPQGGYPPQGYYPQGGYPPMTPPPRKSPLPWILGGAGVVVVALAVVLVLVLTGDDDGPAADQSSVRSTADAMISGVENKDVRAINAVLCEKVPEDQIAKAEERAKSDNEEAPDLTITDIEENGDTATVTIDAGSKGGGEMKLKSVDGSWCVTDLRY